MTIAAAYLTSEGVVFGADSATTVSVSGQDQAQGQVVQLLNHAQKIFEVGPRGAGQLAVCTWGLGSFGVTSHRTLAARLHDLTAGANCSVFESTQKLIELVQPLAEHIPVGQVVGYYIGGIDPDSREPCCFQLEFFPDKPPRTHKMTVGEVRFSGAPDVFSRVFRGFDRSLPGKLFDALRKRLPVVPEGFDQLYVEAFNEVATSLVSAGASDMPIREAIDYIHTYVRMTIKAFKFRFGVPVCGGPIELGFITTDRPFRWVRHKRFGTAILEQDSVHEQEWEHE